MKSTGANTEKIRTVRCRIDIAGRVQGVGFRPFVYRLAEEHRLAGWVNNSPSGVHIEVEGAADAVNDFIIELQEKHPANSTIESFVPKTINPMGTADFHIRESSHDGSRTAFVLPDLATCPDCLREIFDPQNRRYRYPFTNCTNCGPRYSIIESLPYDRATTTMKIFPMCDECRQEYENPSDRRFHAQPNACPDCGPRLELWDKTGKVTERDYDSILAAAEAIREGRIIALKGLGGFQLLADAGNDEAIKKLREGKIRAEKPFAVMFGSLDQAGKVCNISSVEAGLLESVSSPIVLLEKRNVSDGIKISGETAPGNPDLGIMLPYTPLHHLLMAELNVPVVATSGNLSEEPICIDEFEALERLRGVADIFLVHNRPIARQIDDSVVRVMAGREMVLRSARGYAPSTFLQKEILKPSLAIGAHLKNSIALTDGNNIYLSQHIGDLTTKPAHEAMINTIDSMKSIYDLNPVRVIRDYHPDYLSSQYAGTLKLQEMPVQHHYAHVLSCMLDNGLNDNVLGIAWDGTGLGTDGTIWGGEFLLADRSGFKRMGHLRTFRLPGGDRAIMEPRRSAVGVLYELFGPDISGIRELAPLESFKRQELELMVRIIEREVNCPVTSSAGRLFDAVSSILGICHYNNYEGQAAMMLEFEADSTGGGTVYPFSISNSVPYIFNWGPVIKGILDDIGQGLSRSSISARFHMTLAEIAVEMVRLIGEKNIVLTGGCFQNKYLLERIMARLKDSGFKVYYHHLIPPNDGGIAAGQAFFKDKTEKDQ